MCPFCTGNNNAVYCCQKQWIRQLSTISIVYIVQIGRHLSKGYLFHMLYKCDVKSGVLGPHCPCQLFRSDQMGMTKGVIASGALRIHGKVGNVFLKQYASQVTIGTFHISSNKWTVCGTDMCLFWSKLLHKCYALVQKYLCAIVCALMCKICM